MFPEALVSIPVPPESCRVSESKSIAIVPFESGTTKVLVVLPDIVEQSRANIFELSLLFLTLKPLSFVTTAVDVTEDNPV